MSAERVTVVFPRDGVTIDCDREEYELVRRRLAEAPERETVIGVPWNGDRRKGSGGEREATVWIIGGGGMGLAAAVETAELALRLELPLRVRLLEAEAWGGGRDERSASSRCQLWRQGGALWSMTQPQVSLAILASGRRLEALAPHAVRHPLALAVQAESEPELGQFLRPLGVPFEPLPQEVVARWLPTLPLPSGQRFYRVHDGVMDIRLLADALSRRARGLGVEIVNARVERLHRRGDRVTALGLAGGETHLLGPADTVVLASGARSRPLLETAGEEVPGLRVYQSHLIGSPAGIPALVYQMNGGLNCVPHLLPDGTLLDLFGDARRTELPATADRGPLRPDPEMIEALRFEAETAFGCSIPHEGLLSWAACKTELVHEGTHSQAHVAMRVAGINLWLALPGKLTGAFAAAQDLAARIVREQIEEPVARPYWEIALPDTIERKVQAPVLNGHAPVFLKQLA